MQKDKSADYEQYQKLSQDVEEDSEEAQGTLTNDAVLRREVQWQVMQRSGLITPEQYELIRRLDKKPQREREALLDQIGDEVAQLLLNLLLRINQPEPIQYVLALIDEILQDAARIPAFVSLANEEGLPFSPFLRLLNRDMDDRFINQKCAKIASLLMSRSDKVPEDDVKFICRWCAGQLRKDSVRDILIAVSALQCLLRKNDYRLVFHDEDGLKLLALVIRNQVDNPKPKRQVLYQCIYSLWLLGYHAEIASGFSSINGLIPSLVKVLRTEDREKLRRITLATFRNIMDKGENNDQMIHAGIMKILGYLSQKKWGDEDVEENIKCLMESLEKNVITLSSFETYRTELLSGELQWSPVHKSEKFWRENFGRFEENNFQVVGILLEIVRSSSNVKHLTIALYDLGEFMRFHPRGRRIVGSLGGKVDIMKHMTSENEDVQKQALLCVQKMMVHNIRDFSRSAGVETKRS